MYNAKYIFAGLAIFIAAFTSPFWLNVLSPKYERPALALPSDIKDCIESPEYMRAEHMQLLNEWRDEALRDGTREYVATDGRVWDINLQNTCMKCHNNKADFCDACHTRNSVAPYCWDCHVKPKGNE